MKRILSIFKSLIVGLIKHPGIIIPIGVILLVCLIWFAGPYVGIKSIEIRFILIIATLFIWVLFLLLDRYRADKGAKLLEQSMQKQAEEQLISARPDRKEDIEALRGEFEKAVSSLKQSKLGKGRRGNIALYALPWYMIIGPPASGKSTALRHSGLQFPYLDASGKGVQGVGGTRNCDWWFTNEAILLDTAGRYVTEDEDREEWIGFLDLLKQYRKQKPVNGVLVAISIADLFQATEEDLEWHAKNIRERIDELVQRLGIIFPIYLIFTKCDLVRGFVEFFEDFNKAERDQLWGVTLSRTATSDTPAHQIFDNEFQLLCKALHDRRMARLTSALGSQKIRDIYSFPLQLASGQEKLKRFVELLFQPSPYHENPIFRGFYFTSGTQEGTPIDRIMGAIGRASGLPEMISEAFETQKEPKSYFIKNLFTDIIFPDHLLAGASTAAGRQRGYLRLGIFAGSVLVTAAAIAGLSFSFVGNKFIINDVKSASQSFSRMELRDERQFAANIDVLDKLRKRLAQLQTYEQEGIPLRLRGGLYRGSTLYPLVQALYFEKFSKIFLDSTKSAIEVELNGFISSPDSLPSDRDSDYYYSLLKAYLMMSDPSHMDAHFLDQWLQNIWGEFLLVNYGEGRIPEGLRETVARQISFYTFNSDQEGVPSLPKDQRVVKETRRVLLRTPLTERLYSRIRRTTAEGLEPYTINSALQGRKQDVLVNDYRIPGVFTRDGWDTSFQNAMNSVMEESGQEGWVLGVPETKQADLEERIKKLYFDEYVRHWQKYLVSTRIRTVETLPDMVRQLEALTDKDSPMTNLFMDMVRNTDLEREEGYSPQGVTKGLIQKVKKGLRLEGAQDGKEALVIRNPVSLSFKSIHEFISPPEEQKGGVPYEQYLKELNWALDTLKIALESGGEDTAAIFQGSAAEGTKDLLRARRNTERLLQDLDPESRRTVGPLLLQPFEMVVSGLVSRAQATLSRRWRSEVYEPCVQSIAGRYPFRKDGEDATLTDVADFFHPRNGILWRFYEKEIRSFVAEGNDRWRIKGKGEKGAGIYMSPDFLENLRQARIISESLFQKGGPDPQFSFNLYPYPTPGVSEILFSMDGEELRYRNEPQEWHKITWPGGSGTEGTLLQVNISGTRQSRSYPGRWGLFKLLSAGRLTEVSSTNYRVEWNFAVQGSSGLKIRYDIRAHSYKNPFKPGLFTEFRCIDRLG